MKEPCNCGATDCPRCYPADWKDNLLYDKYLDEAVGQSFEKWKIEYKANLAEHKLENQND